jgi:hypothetical protein
MDSKFAVDFSDPKTLEKYSSAFTLSDMEIFIFPELFYPLVLANIISPVIWEWRNDPWFRDIEKKSFTTKANRIKQYIIQNFVFNLDLSTWGLTTKTREIERFSDFFDMQVLRQSNALFGYEGDKYYFDIDIRKHFGLDKFNSDVIPYWKTETIEAMCAFRHKENFTTGGGECVSLSSLYAAAMFVIGKIPLEKIFLIATPLHSQNFITEKEGLITNNRRIVTKNMWFNGTSLSEKARRALENEKVTIVSHISGYIHTIYPDATIDREAYEYFTERLHEFLETELTNIVFINFLRFKSKYKSLFQFECVCPGKKRYILLEKMFEYEHNSKFNASPEARAQLLSEIDGDEFHMSPLPGKIMLNEVEKIINDNPGNSLDVIEDIIIKANNHIPDEIIHEMFVDISAFISIDPRIPDATRNYISTDVPHITTDDSRDEIIHKIVHHSGKSEVSLLAIYVSRLMDRINWLPFVKAALERNPVCFSELEGKSTEEVYKLLAEMTNQSIYDDNRLALPDEVWNFGRGDGIEKALLLADVIIQNNNSADISILAENKRISLTYDKKEYLFESEKKFRKTILIRGREYKII